MFFFNGTKTDEKLYHFWHGPIVLLSAMQAIVEVGGSNMSISVKKTLIFCFTGIAITFWIFGAVYSYFQALVACS